MASETGETGPAGKGARPRGIVETARPAALALAAALGLAAPAKAGEPAVPRLLPLEVPAAEPLPLARDREIAALLQRATIAELQREMAAGRLSSEALVRHLLGRIAARDGRLRSYLQIAPDALDAARRADRLRATGAPLGALHGIPLSVKDNIETAPPLRTTANAELLARHQAPRDAPLVARLRAAGAVILGKASLSELAGVVTEGRLHGGAGAIGGQAVNPHGPFPTAGSSSGSAIAVAAGLAVASVGTETSGSLIAPAAFASVVAMKPTPGLVASEGIVPLLPGNDGAGPVARNVADAALLLGAMDQGETDYAAGLSADALRGRVAGLLPAEAGDAALLARAEAGLRRAGAETRPAPLADPGGRMALFPLLLAAGMKFDMTPYLARRRPEIASLEALVAYNAADPARRIPFGQRLLATLSAAARGLSREDYAALGREVRAAARESLARAFRASGADILVSIDNRHAAYYASAGHPAITVPLGRREAGGEATRLGLARIDMPAGVTLIGKPGEDAALLARAYAFERATGLRLVPEEP